MECNLKLLLHYSEVYFMKTTTAWLLAALGFIAFGCATYQAPIKKNIESTKKISLSFDDAWKHLVSYATKNGMNIKTIDKASGLIAFERAYDGSFTEQYMDCGSGDPIHLHIYSPVTLNITANKTAEKETEVSVNLFGKVNVGNVAEYACFSNGQFEKELFCDIEGHPCPAPVATPTPKKPATQY